MEFNKTFKKDKNGIWYIDGKDVNISMFTFNDIVKSYGTRTHFYHIEGIDNYIIKDTTLYPLLFNKTRTKMLLKNFMMKQELFDNIEFPLGYYRNNKFLKGIIIPYYKDSTSIRKFIYLQPFESLKEYYNHESDDIDNLIAMLLDILELIHKMYQENIIYLDIHAGNFLFYNNEIKVIDFEPGYVYFDSKNGKYYESIIENYASLVRSILRRLKFGEIDFQPEDSFIDAEKNVKLLKKTLER